METIASRCCFCLLLSALLLLSCASPIPDPLAALASPFRCEIGWQFDSTAFRATVSVTPATEENARCETILFLSPPALAGICLTRSEGICTATQDGIPLSDADLSCWSEPLDLLSATAVGKKTAHTVYRGESAISVQALQGDQPCTVILREADRLPLAIVGERITLEVLWFCAT